MEQFTVRLLALLADDGRPSDLGLPQQGDCLAAVGNLRLEGKAGTPASLLISLTARADSVAKSMDNAAAPSGTSGRTSQRLWWIGNAPSRWVRARLRRG